MNSWKDAIDKTADSFDRPDVNLNEFLNAQQRQGELSVLADLSDKQVRKQTIEDAKELLHKLAQAEYNSSSNPNS